MADASKHAGGCNCGAVRYEVAGAPIWSAGCCCRDCAAASGTPFVVWVGFSPEKIRFLSANPRIHTSSAGVLRGFCPECGSSLTYGRDPAFDTDEPILYVAASSLDDPDAFPPTEVVWYAQRPGWFELGRELAGGIPLHDGVSPDHADRAYNNAASKGA